MGSILSSSKDGKGETVTVDSSSENVPETKQSENGVGPNNTSGFINGDEADDVMDRLKDIASDSTTNNEESKNPVSKSINSDFIIRNGFPVLYLPSGEPNIDEPEVIPRHLFWSTNIDQSLQIQNDPSHEWWDKIRHDSSIVFTARTRDDENEAYSSGITYFLPCQMKPRCALEQVVQSIFHLHTKDLDSTMYIPERSGAEWWSLILNENNESTVDDADKVVDLTADDDDDVAEEEDDDVGIHFDADYGLEAQVPNMMVHPRVATVTYLSDYGSPTVIFDKISPSSHSDVQQRCPTKSLAGDVHRAWLSYPKIGKHIAFDGRLLHGAPSTYFPGLNAPCDDVNEPPLKKSRVEATTPSTSIPRTKQKQRITLLVNIWLNHCPMDAEPLDEEIVEQLTTPFSNTDENKMDLNILPRFSWSNSIDLNASIEYPKVDLKPSPNNDPAGEDEIILCNRYVTVTYGATMEAFHDVSQTLLQTTVNAACNSNVELNLHPGVVTIQVGDEVPSDDDNNDNDDGEES